MVSEWNSEVANELDDDLPSVIHIISSSGFFGAEHVVANQCKSMARHRFDVLCLCNDVTSVQDFAAAVNDTTNTQFYTTANQLAPALQQLRHLVKSRSSVPKQCVLHAHGYKALVIAMLASLYFRLPMLVTQHGFTARNSKSKLYNLIGKTICRFYSVKKIICVTDTILKTYQHFGVQPKKLVIVKNAIPIPPKQDRRSEDVNPFKEFGWNYNNNVISFLGRLSDEKNPLFFLEVLSLLIKKDNNIRGLIIGSGPQKEQLENYIIQHQLQQHIKLAGYRKDAAALLEASTLLAITSKTEGTPLVALEAMALKTAIVSTNVGGMPNLIENTVTGMLVDTGHHEDFCRACLNLITEDKLRNDILKGAFDKVNEHHCMNTQSMKLTNYYQEACV